jgi:hypothetical protein
MTPSGSAPNPAEPIPSPLITRAVTAGSGCVVVDWTTVVDVVDVDVLVVLVLVVEVVDVVGALVVDGSNVNSVVAAFASSESPDDEQAASTRPRATTAARERRIMNYIIAESGQ